MEIRNFNFSAFLFVFILTFVSCQKEDREGYFDLGSGEVELYYNETQCSDPWYELVISHNDRSKEVLLKDYFRLKEIEFIDLAYDKAQEDEVITCTACTCFTGSVFYVKIRDDKDIMNKLFKLGFKL